jgi:dTMP kinase
MTARGHLITIEGIDGSGKTTLAAALAAALRDRGQEVLAVREPGGVELAERIRALVNPKSEVSPRAEALLYAAARAQLVGELIEPALASGRLVLLDRFTDSSLAYQGAGRELGTEEIARLNTFATGGLVPARTLLLLLEPAESRRRRAGVPDRIELEDDAFFARIDSAYRAIAAADPVRVRMLDATGTPQKLLADAFRELADLLGSDGSSRPPGGGG